MSIRPESESGTSLRTYAWSSGLVSRMAMKLLHWDSTVSDNSLGRWLTMIVPMPYFRPSLVIRSIAVFAACSL